MKENEDMFYDTNRLKNALLLLKQSKLLSSQDKKAVLDFVQNLKATRVCDSRIARYVYHLRTIREHLGCNFKQAKRKDVENFTIWLNSQDYAADTIADFGMMLKRFYKFLRFGNLDKDTPVPEEVRWISTAIKPNDKKQPKFLTPQEVEKLILAAGCLRDKAMIATGFEGGFRACELLRMNIGSVCFDEKGALAKVSGKTGQRMTRLISSAPILSRYLETHPLRSDPEAPLWTSRARNYFNQRMKWASLDRMLKATAKKSGINKNVFNKMLRHGSATQSAKFLSDSELKIRYGWSMTSRMPAVYVHLSSADLDDKLVSIYTGKPVENKTQFVPLICFRCSEPNTPGTRFCGRCGSPLNRDDILKPILEVNGAKVEIRELVKALRESIGPRAVRDKSGSSQPLPLES